MSWGLRVVCLIAIGIVGCAPGASVPDHSVASEQDEFRKTRVGDGRVEPVTLDVYTDFI